MDVEQLNRIARQVADAIQDREDLLLIQFAVWQRGFADPDAYLATGRIRAVGPRDHIFKLDNIQVRDLLAKSDKEAARSLDALLSEQVRQAST